MKVSKRKIYSLLFLAFSIQFSVFNLCAQENGGVLKGKVKDSTYKFVLSSATVAVYKDKDSVLLQYCIPNNFGEFLFSSLPYNEVLRMQITHVGYPVYERRIVIDTAQNPLDIGWVYMNQYGKSEEEVVVTAVAPVRMNGDTLEFNPRAFKLDEKDTPEDFIRKLRDFTIWGDGEITYRGKKISTLYVDGKPFLGGSDITAATQNISMDAIDVLQVYKQHIEKNPLDSTLMANLKLKEDKKMGHFGKVTAGYGTDKRYATDAMLAGFNKKMQVSVVGTTNNINKIANNVDELIRYSSFKGEGNNLDYQPDFTMAGLNKPVTVGAKFQYDFIPDVEYQKSERVNANYFLNHNTSLVDRNTVTSILLKPDSVLTRNSKTLNTDIYTNQNFNSNYSKTTKKYIFDINANGTINYTESKINSTDEQKRTGSGIISSGAFSSENKNLMKNAGFSAGFTKNSYSDYYSDSKKNKRPVGFTARYSFDITNNDGKGNNRSSFTEVNHPEAAKEFDRLYAQKYSRQLSHTLYAEYPYLKQLILGRKRLWDINMLLRGTFRFHNNDYKSSVLDMEKTSGTYKQNDYLSNNRSENITNLTPELSLSKQYYKGLTNRYNKSVSVNFIARMQHYAMLHNGKHAFQNFNYSYNYFLPQASAVYNNHQYGSYEAEYQLSYSTNIDYAGVNQIAPLVDSTNLWDIPMGNPNIKPQYNSRYAFKYSIESRRPKNPYEFEFNADISTVMNKMTDSSFYDNSGKMLAYTVNANGYKYWHMGTDFKKSYSPNSNNTFELITSYNLYRNYLPIYVNKLSVISRSLSQNINANLGYTYKDIIAIKIQQGINFYNALQNNDENSAFKNNNWYTRFIGILQFPRNFSWSSNITYNKSASNNQQPVRYTIWNASLTYRFLKGNRGEIKFSALDLLRQNKSVINSGSGNKQIFGYNNVLQQYFMLSISYYPRKFGK